MRSIAKSSESEIRLYIVVRTDLASMNPGRVAAQVSHAASQAAAVGFSSDKDTYSWDFYREWSNQANGFGTAIVLAIPPDRSLDQEYSKILSQLAMNAPSGLVIDPEYAVRDGDFVHLIPEIATCFWYMCRVDFAPDNDYELYRG